MSDKPQLSCQLSSAFLYNSYTCGATHATSMIGSIKAGSLEASERASRAPVDIVTVIDVSGSMSGAKLELVKTALSFMIQQLKSEDRVAIVSFHSQVKVEMPLTEMTSSSKTHALSVVQQLRAQGSTQLHPGLLQGLQQIKERSERTKNKVASVLLFTDGQADGGASTTPGIIASTKDMLNKIPDVCSVSTFGFGSDHDVPLLKGVAETGNGMFYYIDKVADIATSFADCLGGLLSVVAQHIELRIEKKGATSMTISTSYPVTNVTPNSVWTVKLNDLFSEENRDIILNVDLPKCDTTDKFEVAQFTLTYLNVINGARETVTHIAEVARPTSVPADQIANDTVLRQLNRAEVTRALASAVELGLKNDITGAQKILDSAVTNINKTKCNDAYTQNLIKDLQQAKTELSNQQSFQHGGYQQMTSKVASHAQQRSNISTVSAYSNSCQMAQNVSVQSYMQSAPQQQAPTYPSYSAPQQQAPQSSSGLFSNVGRFFGLGGGQQQQSNSISPQRYGGIPNQAPQLLAPQMQQQQQVSPQLYGGIPNNNNAMDVDDLLSYNAMPVVQQQQQAPQQQQQP